MAMKTLTHALALVLLPAAEANFLGALPGRGGSGREGWPADGPPPPGQDFNPLGMILSETCIRSLEPWAEENLKPEPGQEPGPMMAVDMCKKVPGALPQECQDPSDAEVFECGCAFLNDKEFTEEWLKDPDNFDKNIERSMEDVGVNQSLSCFMKPSSRECAKSQARGKTELKNCKASGDYFKFTRYVASKHPLPWSAASTAELCLPKKCKSMIPKIAKIVQVIAVHAEEGPPGPPPSAPGAAAALFPWALVAGATAAPPKPMAVPVIPRRQPDTLITRRLSEVTSTAAKGVESHNPLKPLSLLVQPLRLAATYGAEPGMPFSNEKCQLGENPNPAAICVKDKFKQEQLSGCGEFEKNIINCGCTFMTDPTIQKNANMTMMAKDVAKQIECLSKDLLNTEQDACKHLTKATLEDLGTCKKGEKPDWGYCVTGNGVIADFPGKWFTTRLSYLLGMCLPNSCSAVLTSPELMEMMTKLMEKAKAEGKLRRQQQEEALKRNKVAADKAIADATTACEKSCDATGLTLPTTYGEIPIHCQGFSPPCNVDTWVMDMYRDDYIECAKVNEWMACPRGRCKWVADGPSMNSGVCVSRESDAAREAREEERFLSACTDGKCTLPIKCGSDADQKFIDDVGKKSRRTVRTGMKIKGVNYDKLMANPKLRERFEKAAKKAIARKCGNGVTDEDVIVTLRPGSVIVDATIVPDDSTDAEALVKTLESERQALSDAVVEDVKAIEGISEVEEGSISGTEAEPPETEGSNAIEPVSPTGDKLEDAGQENGGSPTPSPDGDDGGKKGGFPIMYVVIGLALLVAAGVGVMFVMKKASPDKRRPQQGTEMGSHGER